MRSSPPPSPLNAHHARVRTKFVPVMARGTHLAFLLVVALLADLAKSLPQQSKSRRPAPIFKKLAGLELPSNATLIRENIVDNFSCKDRIYGYYADVENECQIFHVCLPQERNAFKWSFICPEETVFNQATFVCTRTENSIPCEESEKYYALNEEIGKEVEEEEEENTKERTTPSLNPEENEVTSARPSSRTSRVLGRQRSSRRGR